MAAPLFDCYAEYARATRLMSDNETVDFTVDILFHYTEIHMGNIHLLTVCITPLFKKTIRERKQSIEAHSAINKKNESVSYQVRIVTDAERSLAEFSMRVNASFPRYLYSCGVGSYLMSKMIDWTRGIAPTAELKPVIIEQMAPEDITARERRNKFFAKHGFEYSFEGSGNSLNGATKATIIGKLRSSTNDRKIQILDSVTQEITNIFGELAEARNRNKTIRDSVEKVRKEYQALKDRKNVFMLISMVSVVLLIVTWI